jgi:hypothetical protein
VLGLVKGFFCIYCDDQVVFVFASIDVLYYIYRFAYVQPPLQPWDEAHLVMVNDLSYVLLFLVCHYFIENFWHLCSLGKLACSSPFLEVSLFGFGMRVILAS